MNRKQIDACLGWHIRHHKGFYYNNVRYSGVSFHDDCIDIHNYDVRSIVYIKYDDIIDIQRVNVSGELRKIIITK